MDGQDEQDVFWRRKASKYYPANPVYPCSNLFSACFARPIFCIFAPLPATPFDRLDRLTAGGPLRQSSGQVRSGAGHYRVLRSPCILQLSLQLPHSSPIIPYSFQNTLFFHFQDVLLHGIDADT